MSEERGSVDLVGYLLRELPEEQMEEIEQKYFSNEESFEELQQTEAELIDSYVAGELEPVRKQKFEQLYLVVPDRRQRVQFAEALRVKASEARPEIVSLPPKKWLSNRVVAAAVVVFAIVGALIIGELIRLQGENEFALKEIERLKAQSKTMEQKSKSQETKIGELSKQLDTAQMDEDFQQPKPIHGSQPQPAFLAVIMNPGLTRDSSRMQTIDITKNINFVRFELKLDRDPFPSYRVSLQTAGGDDLWTLGLLKPSVTRQGKTITFDLPTNRVEQRDYVLLLQGKSPGGKFENVSAYPFRLRKS